MVGVFFIELIFINFFMKWVVLKTFVIEREVTLRWPYESAIKRPYFHVKPLERDQLKNWYAYLDFEIRQKKKSRIIFLFERCM